MGDLLRSLEAGPELTSAANLSLSREGLVVASYPSHHVAVFTINGKKLRSELHSDNVQVRPDLSLDEAFKISSRFLQYRVFSKLDLALMRAHINPLSPQCQIKSSLL